MAEARRPTWEEAQELKKRLSCLGQEIKACNIRAEDLPCGLDDDARQAILRGADRRRLDLLREYERLASSIKDPDFSGMSESDRAAEAERLRQEKLQEARRLQTEGNNPYGSELEGLARILDFDPKQGGIYYNRLNFVDLATFDHDDESPIGPMRFTDRVFEDNKATVCDAVNILSVKIACSDIGFPIQVYGTVVARDCTDDKCVYLFRRDSDHCQLINSKKEPLILTGPKRGLALMCDDYVETDLWVKDHQGHSREFSKGVLTIWGVVHRPVKECKVERISLATRLSTVAVMYAVVKSAVEATIAVEVLQGEFNGVITAHTTGIKRSLVLYDTSKVAGGNCHGVIQLMRSAVSVYVKDTLIIFPKTTGGISAGLKCTPRCSGGDEIVFPLGDVLMRVKVAWSIMEP